MVEPGAALTVAAGGIELVLTGVVGGVFADVLSGVAAGGCAVVAGTELAAS